MPKINIGSVELYFETYGSGEALVLITGFGVDHLVWQPIIEQFAERYRVIVFDNRGSGQSEYPDIPFTIDMLAEDTISLCNKLGITKARFIGSSMGGMILQTIAYRYPEYVISAVLENTNSKTDVRFWLFSEGRYALMNLDIDKKTMAQLSLPWAFSSAFLKQKGVIDMLIQLTVENPYPFTAKGFKNQRHALDNFNSKEWLHKINIPCLVTSSDKDMIFDEADIIELAKQIPNAEYYSFKEVGHVPHIEKTEEFCKLVFDFFNRY